MITPGPPASASRGGPARGGGAIDLGGVRGSMGITIQGIDELEEESVY